MSKKLKPIQFNEELLKKIEDYRYTKRYPSFTSAVISLIKAGLDAPD